MKTIKDYIQFAIDNLYKTTNFSNTFIKLNGVEKNDGQYWICYIEDIFNIETKGATNLIETITSKPFIEAIARGILKKENWKVEDKEYKYLLDDKIDSITFRQAFAIRDNKLEEFINNLLTK